MEIEEPCQRLGTRLTRALGVRSGRTSRRMRRAMTEFASEGPFEQAATRIREHYQVEVSRERVRRICLAEAARVAGREPEKVRTLKGDGARWIVAEADGTMLPVVETDSAPQGYDRRKHRKVRWVETRLLAARELGRASTHYQATMDCVDKAGELWSVAAALAGWGSKTRIHVVSDGAPWIEQQSQRQFGKQGRFLVDLYHVCDYLAAANERNPDFSLERQKTMLLEGRSRELLAELSTRLESKETSEKEAPVRSACRYLSNRLEQLDYRTARANGLPVGSGLIESGNRHVLQSRLKRAGTWWNPQSLRNMTQLRIAKAEGQWSRIWTN